MLAVDNALMRFLSPNKRTPRLGQFGQHVCGVLHKSPGRPQVQEPVQAGRTPPGMGSVQPALAQSSARARAPEYRTGQTVQEQCSGRRVVSTPTDSPTAVEEIRQSGSRPVCVSRKRSLSGIFLQEQERAGPCVAPPPALCFSPRLSPASGDRTDQGRKMLSIAGGTVLEKPTLVPSRDAVSKYCPVASTSEERPPLTGPRLDLASSPGTMVPSCLGHQRVHVGLPKGVLNTITQARAPSTRRLYSSKWSVFSGWCTARGVSPTDCGVTEVFSFLQELLDEGRAPSTLKVYVAAIAAFSGTTLGQTPERSSSSVDASPRPPTTLESLSRSSQSTSSDHSQSPNPDWVDTFLIPWDKLPEELMQLLERGKRPRTRKEMVQIVVFKPGKRKTHVVNDMNPQPNQNYTGSAVAQVFKDRGGWSTNLPATDKYAKTGKSKKNKYFSVATRNDLEANAVVQEPSSVVQEPSSVVQEPSSVVQEPSSVVQEPSSVVQEPTSVVQEPSSVVQEPSSVLQEPTSVVQEPTSVVQEPSSVLQEPTSVVQEPSSVVQEPSSVVQEPSSVVQEPTSVVQEPSSVVQEPTSVVQELTSVVQEPSSVVQEPSSVVQEPSSVVQEPSSVVQELTSVVQEPSSVGQEPSSVGQELTSVVQEPSSVVQEPSSVLQELASVVQEPSSVGQEPSSVVQELTSVVQEPSSVGQEPSSVVQELTSVVQEPSSVVQELTSVVQEPSSVGQEPSSVVQELTSVVQEPSSVVQELTSVVQEPSSVVQELTSVVQEPSSVVQELTSVVQEPSSVVQELTSVVQELTSVVQEPSSVVQELTSVVQEPSSVVQELTSVVQRECVGPVEVD
ncbi:unnamed protein product [Leuciscus chuanchicus]